MSTSLRVQIFFVLVTLILTVSAIIGGIVAPEQELHYYHLFSPIIIAALCILPSCVTYFKKEPTVKQYIFRLVIELTLIECIVLSVVTPPDNTANDKTAFYLIMGTVILIIYILAELTAWYQKYRQSQQFTSQLKKLQTHQI